MVVHHTGGVVHSQTDLVLPFAGLGPPQPDLVFAELTGDVRDHLSHVQTLPGAVITSDERHDACMRVNDKTPNAALTDGVILLT